MEIYPRTGPTTKPWTAAAKPDDWVERVEFAIAVALQLAIALVSVSSLIRGQYRVAFAGCLIFMLTFVPAIIERRLKIQLPIEVTLITCLFLYASFFLGEIKDFYELYWWWDLALHGTSAILIGMVGFVSIYPFYMTNRVQVAPVYVALFTFALAVTVGTLWEIFEFLMDRYIGLNMQRTGLVDTMTDLLVNASGALMAAVIGYFFVRGDNRRIARQMIRKIASRQIRVGSDVDGDNT
jgi:hypothetical protein